MSNLHARTYRHEGSHRPTLVHSTRAEARGHQWGWLAAGLVLAFSIPFVLTDLTSINRDVYYGVFIGGVFAFVGAWLRFGVGSPLVLLARNWLWGVVLGLAFATVMAGIVLNEPATAHPGGLDFVAAITWRGLLYGLADGVILSAFPILAVFAAFAGRHVLGRWRGRIAVGTLALGVSLLFTAVYHLGYSDFRGEKLKKPLAGDVIWSVPTLVTLSPIASPLTHAGLHIAAVVHSYDTDTFLPPHRTSVGSSRPDLQAMLDELVEGPARIAPGATAYVSDSGDSWLGASGLSAVRTGEPMPTDARIHLESVSKIWTAVLIHQLAEAGTLQLSDTVERWLPGLLPYGDRLTVAQLLIHTSGLIDNNDIARDPEPFLARVTLPAPKSRSDVKVFAPRGGPGPSCARVYPLRRTVSSPAVLSGAMRALLAGPSAVERKAGYGGWFSTRTAGTLRSVQLSRAVAYVDFRDFSRLIPNASSSCGSAMLLAQLNRTATQFPTIRRAVYSFDGSRRAFYEWLQRAEPGVTR